jgi:hypothetical protein
LYRKIFKEPFIVKHLTEYRFNRREFIKGASSLLAASVLSKIPPLPAQAALSFINGPIIADHTVVAAYDTIPQTYIDLVKQMLVSVSGESHSRGYRYGMDLLAEQDSKFPIQTFTASNSTPPPTHNPSHPKLRFGGMRRYTYGWTTNTGEDTFFTNVDAITGIKETIQYSHDNSNPLSVIGFGWCWDMNWHNGPGNGSSPNELDPVHEVHWCGSSVGGPEGDRRWGLNAEDAALTGNSICMDTYLNAVEEYRTYCAQNSYACVPIFTTGPVDNYSGESGFQREIKHDYMRSFVQQDVNRVLFDYADILCWNDAGEQNILSWNDDGTPRPYAQIHPDNDAEYDGGEGSCHISQAGCIRLAKAMWWLLARIAGWDGNADPGPTLTERAYLPMIQK